jgi:hypothetical protein
MEALFSFGSVPRLHNEDPRPAELLIEKSREGVEGWEFSFEEKS